MHVVAIHNISDPEKFWSTVQSTPIPDGITLHSSLPNQTGGKAVCHWEGESLKAIKNLVEEAVGQYSTNEYYEVNAETAIGL